MWKEWWTGRIRFTKRLSRTCQQAREKIAKALEADTWFFMDDNAVTFEEIANVSKFNLPDELMTFIADQKQLPYIVMAKKMSDEGLPPESMEIMFNNIMQLMKSMKVKTE
jgi:hypothetical protein